MDKIYVVQKVLYTIIKGLQKYNTTKKRRKGGSHMKDTTTEKLQKTHLLWSPKSGVPQDTKGKRKIILCSK